MPFLSPSWSLRRVRLVRTLSCVVAVLSAGCIAVSVEREFGLKTADGWLVGVGNGCVQIGYNPDRFSEANYPYGSWTQGNGVYYTFAWHGDWLTAWRPFRVSVPPAEMIVVPLWPIAVASLFAAGWSIGHLAGTRRGRERGCLTCGYDLSKTPVADGRRVCPECGAARTELQ